MEEKDKLISSPNNTIITPVTKETEMYSNKAIVRSKNYSTISPELEKLLSAPTSVTIPSEQNKSVCVAKYEALSPEEINSVSEEDSVTVISEQNKLPSAPKPVKVTPKVIKLLGVPKSVTILKENKLVYSVALQSEQNKLMNAPNSVTALSTENCLIPTTNSMTLMPELNKLVTIPNSMTVTSELKKTNNSPRRPALRSQSSRSSTRSRYRGPGSSAYRKLRRRAVFKNGDCNVIQCHVSKRRRRYLQDIFTTLVDTQWRWTILVFALSFLSSWFGFGCIWWLIAYTHGDLDPENLKPNSNWSPCVANINSFASCFLFSLETQHTIGYGGRATTEECPEAIITMCMQSIWGMMIQAFMVGIIFAKMARPKQRTQTLLFSRNAVICQRDGQLCLMFRVGDMREKSHLISAQVRAQMIRPRATKEGEYLSPFLTELKLNVDDYSSDIFLIWPKVVVHKIDSSSPLYTLSAADLINERFEIVVILEGTTESTGQTTQARSSYLPPEILWGHRFEPLVSYNKERLSYQVDYSLFHNTYQVDTPLCSAQELQTFTEASGALTYENNYAYH